MTKNQDTEQQSYSSDKKTSAIKTNMMLVIGAFIALGQWGDATVVAKDIYFGVVSNFSHKYEYEKLSKVNVGSNLKYIYQQFGEPQFTKKSKYISTTVFSYYFTPKYILTLISSEQRITGYSITALTDDFSPYDLLNKGSTEAGKTLAQKAQNFSNFTLDHHNINYMVVQKQLGRESLFINKYYGGIDYQANNNLPLPQIRKAYAQLNSKGLDLPLQNKIKDLSAKIVTNFYGVGEVDISLMTDAILTQFEYTLYAKSQS